MRARMSEAVVRVSRISRNRRADRRCRLKRNLPAGEHEYGGMAPKGTSKDLRALDAQIHATVFDGRDRGLRDARELGKPALAQVLELAQNTE